MSNKSKSYEKNFEILEDITDSLNKDEIGIDDLVEKTKEALDAARNCIEILNQQKGEFIKLENEFSSLLKSTTEKDRNNNDKTGKNSTGEDDPF